MTAQETLVEVLWKAYQSLPRSQRGGLMRRIIAYEPLSEDEIDHLLIEKARQGKGRDISLDEYMKHRSRKRSP